MSTNGLVGYDTTLTRLGSRVQFPLGVEVLYFYYFIYFNLLLITIICTLSNIELLASTLPIVTSGIL